MAVFLGSNCQVVCEKTPLPFLTLTNEELTNEEDVF